MLYVFIEYLKFLWLTFKLSEPLNLNHELVYIFGSQNFMSEF